MLTSPEILVPIRFSPCSINALRVAIGMAAPQGDLTLLHVIDQHFVEDAVAAGWGSSDDIRTRLKEQAEANFTNTLSSLEIGEVDVEKMIVIGVPFIEILKIARDLDLPMIVMGVKGRSTPSEELLFGSTARKSCAGQECRCCACPFELV